MVLEPRVAVELRVHPRQMIGLAVVLDRKLPVAVRRQGQRGIADTRTQLRPAVRAEERLSAPHELGGVLLEGRSIAAQIDVQDAEKDGTAHRLQPMGRVVEAARVVLIHSADVRGRLQVAVCRVGPAVVTAGDEPLHLRRAQQRASCRGGCTRCEIRAARRDDRAPRGAAAP